MTELADLLEQIPVDIFIRNNGRIYWIAEEEYSEEDKEE